MAVNVQAAVEAQLLGVNLTGMVARTTADVDEKKQTTTEFLIMPSALDENEPITVQKVVDEINKTIYKIENNTDDTSGMTEDSKKVSAESIENAMDIVGLKGAELTFMQTFIHYKKVVESGGAEDPGTEVSKVMEYAIGIHIKGENPQTDDFKFLQIKEVYINVWDTSNQKVLERMQIWTPEQLEQK